MSSLEREMIALERVAEQAELMALETQSRLEAEILVSHNSRAEYRAAAEEAARLQSDLAAAHAESEALRTVLTDR